MLITNLNNYMIYKITCLDLSLFQVRYEVKDPFTVFDKIKGTPKYWQTVKFDMIAKLENIGPFHWFFTLSCGDMRWSSNFTPLLEKLGCKIQYNINNEGQEKVSHIFHNKSKNYNDYKKKNM